MIKFVFTNGVQSVELKHVKSIEWSSDSSPDVLVNTTTREGKKTRTITINGFINKGIFKDNVRAQQELEANLLAVATGTLEYTGAHNVENVRYLGIEFSEFRGNPICPFKIKFKTEEVNIHAHYPIKIGDLVLAPRYGYDHAKVSESISTQGSDEQLSGLHRRSITIKGMIIGQTLEDVNEKQQLLIASIEDVDDLVLTLSDDSGDYVSTITVKPKGINFDAPKLRNDLAAREFSCDFVTHDDYSKEPYTLGESSATFAGITIDVVDNFDHDKEFENSGSGASSYSILEETVSVSGKKYFTNYSTYTTFRDLFESIPFATYLFTSDTANVLELTDVSIGKFERDGNAVDESKRYAASVSLNFKWKKTIQQTNYAALTAYFGVTFYKVPSITFGVSIDSFGNVTSRTLSLNGEIKGSAQLTTFKALVGTTVNFEGAYTNLIVTGASVSGVDTYNDAGTQVTVYKVSLNASQLDKSNQAVSFIRGLFRMDSAGASGTSYSGETIQFENINNVTKSISNRWDAQTLKFIVTSITLSVNGEVYDTDNGNGKPSNPNKMIDLFNKIDALLNAGKSEQSAANTVPSGEVLPSNGSIHYLLNSINIGSWQPGVAPEILAGGNGSKGARYWKQSVSLSATAVYDLSSSSNSQPDAIESRSVDISLEVPKFTQLQVAGFGTVFKRIGTTPEKATITHQKQFKDARSYVPNDYGFGGAPPTAAGWRGNGRSVLTKENKDNRGLSNRWTVEYEATEKLGT